MTREETQLLWGGASSKAISAGATEITDAFLFDVDDWAAQLQIDANNGGTPASGDTVDVYILWSTGDILGDSGDDYDTVEHAQWLCRLDTYPANTPGENPARRTVDLPLLAAKGCKVLATNGSVGRTITVRARISTLRGAVS